jgi:hypothetical protein
MEPECGMLAALFRKLPEIPLLIIYHGQFKMHGFYGAGMG